MTLGRWGGRWIDYTSKASKNIPVESSFSSTGLGYIRHKNNIFYHSVGVNSVAVQILHHNQMCYSNWHVAALRDQSVRGVVRIELSSGPNAVTQRFMSIIAQLPLVILLLWMALTEMR